MKYKPSKFNVYFQSDGNCFITNTLSASVMSFDPKNFFDIKNNILTDFDNEEIKLLSQQGFIVNDNLDEISLLRNTYFSCKLDNTEAHLTICPTLECNFSCPYCYENRVSGIMTSETQENLLSFTKNLLENGVKKLYVTWYGGEPLLYPSIIDNVNSAIKTLCNKYTVNFIVSMISNGYLIDKNIDLLKKLNLSSIQITLDGSKDTHNKRRFLKNGTNTFDVIVRNIIEASKITKVSVRVNIDKTNIDSYQDVKQIFKEFDNIECYYAPVTIEKNQSETIKNNCFSPKEYDKFYNLIGSDLLLNFNSGIKCCSAELKNTYVIDPFGNMYKCLNDIGNPDYIISTLKNYDYECNPSVVAKYLGRDPFSESECFDCCFLPQCYGGCVWNYKSNGIHSCKSIKYLLVNQLIKKYYLGGENL